MKYEDLTRRERVQLMLSNEKAYLDLLTKDCWYLLLDGLAGTKPYVRPPSAPEEEWRHILREQAGQQN